MVGFLQIDRDLFEDSIFDDKKYGRLQAFLDLCNMAAIKPYSFFVRGIKVDVMPMQLAKSADYLASKWTWNKRTVLCFLDALQKEGYITLQKSRLITIVTIKKGLVAAPQNALQSTPENALQNALQSTLQNALPYDNIDNIDKEINNIPPIIPQGDGEISPAEISEMKRRLSELQKENDELKKKNAKKEKARGFDVRADLSYVDEAHMSMWVEWLDYKDQIKKQYNTQVGAKKAYTQWTNLSMGNLAKAQAIIDQSQMRSWDGLFDVKDWKESTNESKKPMQQPANSGMVIINGKEWQV